MTAVSFHIGPLHGDVQADLSRTRQMAYAWCLPLSGASFCITVASNTGKVHTVQVRDMTIKQLLQAWLKPRLGRVVSIRRVVSIHRHKA